MSGPAPIRRETPPRMFPTRSTSRIADTRSRTVRVCVEKILPALRNIQPSGIVLVPLGRRVCQVSQQTAAESTRAEEKHMAPQGRKSPCSLLTPADRRTSSPTLRIQTAQGTDSLLITLRCASDSDGEDRRAEPRRSPWPLAKVALRGAVDAECPSGAHREYGPRDNSSRTRARAGVDAFVHSDNVVQELAADASHPALCDAILPRCLHTGALRFETSRLEEFENFGFELRITIQNHVPVGVRFRKSFTQLLHDPGSSWMASDIEMQDSPPLVLDDEKQ